jgi:hypothetical protein
MCIKDTTTQEERVERSAIKDRKFRKRIKEISYRDEGELFMKALNNACFLKLQKLDNNEVNVM